jgi:hypothetical protein
MQDVRVDHGLLPGATRSTSLGSRLQLKQVT